VKKRQKISPKCKETPKSEKSPKNKYWRFDFGDSSRVYALRDFFRIQPSVLSLQNNKNGQKVVFIGKMLLIV